MRKTTLLLAVLAAAIVAASVTADAKANKRQGAKPAAAATDPNEPGRRFVATGLSQFFVPFQSLAQPSAAEKPAMKAKKKKRVAKAARKKGKK